MLTDLKRRGLSAHTRTYTRATLRRALTIAEKRGYVARNVARLVEPPGTPRPKLDDTPTVEEMRLLMKAAQR